mgnify:CR=1 FL=1
MSETLYIQTDKNMQVTSEKVHLMDIAQLSCSDSRILNRCRVLKVASLPAGKYGRYPVSIIEVIRKIQQAEKNLEIVHVGEAEFLLTYTALEKKGQAAAWIKTIFVCLLTFFGTMFSIMTFNTDVDVEGLFEQIHTQFTGKPSDGFSALEISYSLGIGVGVVCFFNHFGRRKLTEDPTPLEVEMRAYEDQVDTTIIEQEKRKQQDPL